MDRPHVVKSCECCGWTRWFPLHLYKYPNGCLGRSILWKVDGHIVTSCHQNHEQSCGSNMLAPKKRPSDPHCCLCHHSNHHYITPLHFEKIDSKPTKHGTFAMKQCWNIDAQGPQNTSLARFGSTLVPSSMAQVVAGFGKTLAVWKALPVVFWVSGSCGAKPFWTNNQEITDFHSLMENSTHLIINHFPFSKKITLRCGRNSRKENTRSKNHGPFGIKANCKIPMGFCQVGRDLLAMAGLGDMELVRNKQLIENLNIWMQTKIHVLMTLLLFQSNHPCLCSKWVVHPVS